MTRTAPAANTSDITVTIEGLATNGQFTLNGTASDRKEMLKIRQCLQDGSHDSPATIHIHGGERLHSEPLLIRLFALVQPVVVAKNACYGNIAVLQSDAPEPRPRSEPLGASLRGQAEHYYMRQRKPVVNGSYVYPADPLFVKKNKAVAQYFHDLNIQSLSSLLRDEFITNDQRNSLKHMGDDRLALELLMIHGLHEPLTPENHKPIEEMARDWARAVNDAKVPQQGVMSDAPKTVQQGLKIFRGREVG